MNLRIFENAEELSRAAARALLQSGAKTIGLTGGSTPKRMYELLADSVPSDVTWVLVDERFVPFDDPRSNAAMIERTLFRHGRPPAGRWLYFRTEVGDAAATAAEFEQRWHELGIDSVDLMLLGCGEDGHTASLFPGTTALDVDDRVTTEVFVPRLDEWRVTLTMPVIRAARRRLVLAAGASKAPVLREIRDGARPPVVLATEGVETWWLVDRAAAGSATV